MKCLELGKFYSGFVTDNMKIYISYGFFEDHILNLELGFSENELYAAYNGIRDRLKRYPPKKLESSSSRGIMSNKNQPTKQEAMKDGRLQIAKYMQILRDIQKENEPV